MLWELTVQGRSFARVRIVSLPLIDYSRFGLWCAQFTNGAGEDMRYLLVFSGLSLRMYRRSRGSPAFLVAQRRECPGEPVGTVAGTHPGPVARAPGQGGPPGLNQARQHWGRLAFLDRDNPGDQPAVFRHVDRLAVPDPGEHLTRVVPQIPGTDGVRIGRHKTGVSQDCGHNRACPSGAGAPVRPDRSI